MSNFLKLTFVLMLFTVPAFAAQGPEADTTTAGTNDLTSCPKGARYVVDPNQREKILAGDPGASTPDETSGNTANTAETRVQEKSGTSKP